MPRFRAQLTLLVAIAIGVGASSALAGDKKFFDLDEWEDRDDGWHWEGAVGVVAGLTLNEIQQGQDRKIEELWAGVSLSAGFRWRQNFDKKNIFGESASSAAWCAPVMCGPLGFLFMPGGAFMGNELGLDAHLEVARARLPNRDVYRIALGFKPIFRASRDSRARTGTFIGLLQPELRFALIDTRLERFELLFHPYPIGLLVGRHLGIELDGGPIVSVPLAGERVQFGASGTLTLVVF